MLNTEFGIFITVLVVIICYFLLEYHTQVLKTK
jgi:hypothetical protein